MEQLLQVQVTAKPGTISDNLDAVEASIREKAGEYGSIVVTEDNIADGKQFLADIRKEKAALDQQRKDIKKAWMKPYEAFEKRAKEIIGLYDKPIAAISGQLDGYEKRRKKEKRREIRNIYDFVKGDLADWLPLEAIYDTHWENKTCKEKDIREAMERCFDQIKLSISTIKQMESEFEEKGLAVLKSTRSLQEALAEINAQEKKKREMEAYHQRQKELEEQKKLEEQRRLEEQKRLEEQRRLEEQKRLEEERLAREAQEDAETQDVLAAEEAPAGQESGSGAAFGEGIAGEGLPFGFDVPFAQPEETEAEDFSFEDMPFAPAKDYIVTAAVDENLLEDVKMFLDSLGIEYEVK